MSKSEYSRMAIIMACLTLEAFLMIGGLSSFAYATGAGSENFRLGSCFVLAQAVVILLVYWRWYTKANRAAAELYNIQEMRKKAFERIPGYIFLSFILTGFIAVAGLAATLLQMIFVDISRIYCMSSVLSEFLIGNLTLLILMRTAGLPDRVLGRY